MKRLLTVALVAAAALVGWADAVYINEFNIKAGETVTLELNLANDIAYKSMQADFDFPEGLSIVCDANNNPVFSSTSRTATHLIRGSRPQGTGDNHYRIGMITMANSITAGDGAIATFQVVASEDFVGEHTITLSAINVGDESYVNYVLDDAACTVRSSMFTLSEALTLDDGAMCMITDNLVAVAQIGEHVYATTAEANAWIRLDMNASEKLLNGAILKDVIGVVADLTTAPSMKVTSFVDDGETTGAIAIKKINLVYGFDMPQLSEVVYFTGYYYDNNLRGFRSNGARGQSLTLDDEYFGDLNLSEGQRCMALVGIEVKEPWPAGVAAGPRRAYDYDFQNLNGKVIDLERGDVATGVDEVAVASEVAEVRYVSPAGIVSREPHSGVNIVVTRYTNGTQKTTKIVF